MSLYRRGGKAVLDRVLAAAGLIALAPVIALVAAVVRVRLGSPVIFSQLRPGLHGAPFTLHKFRTMTDARDAGGALLPDHQRLTRFGRFLRSTSMDELPELWNVLKGEMSLVGPRPLLMEYLPLYSLDQARRHEARPGITGLAQVSGRNAASWEEQLAVDVRYVDHHSMRMDLRIILTTMGRVLTRHGVTQPGAATRERFRGSNG